jgi:hypothetical protein
MKEEDEFIEIVQENTTPLQQIFSVGFFWVGVVATLYLATTTSTSGALLLGAFFHLYRHFWIQNRKKYHVLPNRFLASRFYDVFFTQPKKKQNLANCFKAGHFFLIIGFVMTWALTNNLTSPRYLKDMEVIQGRYEGYKEVWGKGTSRHYVLSFRKDNGELVQFRTIKTNGPDDKVLALEKHKKSGEIYTVWGCFDRSMFFPLYPEWREHRLLEQIVGAKYQRLWDEDWQRRMEQAERFLLKIGVIILCCAVPFYLYGWFVIATKHQNYSNSNTSKQQEY